MSKVADIITLDNGMRIVTENLPFVRSVSFGIWVKNGSRNEDSVTNGISHFIEHMMFKGTQRRTAKEIADTMDEVGGQLNAFTAKEYTCYYARTLDTHFDVALDVLSDMFFNSRFDEAEIQKERNVIMEEISMYEDTPEDLVHDLLQYRVYNDSSLGLSILGKPESISAFDNARFKSFMRSRYTPKNTVIAIAGNIGEDSAVICEKIKKAFAPFESYNEGETGACDDKPKYMPGFIKKEKDIEQVHLCVGFPGIPNGTDEIYTMAAVNTLLGGGMSSRLFQKIREEHGMAYAVYSYHTAFADEGIFAVYAGLNPAQTEDVLSLITGEIRRLFTEKVTERQLAKIKEQLKSNYILSLESAANRMNSIGRNLLMLDRIVTADELIQKIDAVNLDMFYELSEKVFKMEQMSMAIVGNTDFDIQIPYQASNL